LLSLGARAQAAAPEVKTEEIQKIGAVLEGAICGVDECCPPTTAKLVFIGVGTVAIALVSFLLIVRLVERSFINRDASAVMGRHTGISLSLLITAVGFAVTAYLVTGCWPMRFWIGLGFVGGVWALHGLYTLIAVRK
jgi:hypothetical protein